MIPQRLQRLGGNWRAILVEVLQREISDPRLETVTITDLRLSTDAKMAKVYWVVHGSEEAIEEAEKGLSAAAGYMRKSIARRSKVKNVPALRFYYDDRYDTADRVSQLLGQDSPTHPSGGEEMEVSSEFSEVEKS